MVVKNVIYNSYIQVLSFANCKKKYARTVGTYTLSNDVNTAGTINVQNGNALDITGIVIDGTRPAIDGGGTPGCSSSCPGHRVFYVQPYSGPQRFSLLGLPVP